RHVSPPPSFINIMSITTVSQGLSTALLVAGRGDQQELETLLRGIVFQRVVLNGSHQVPTLREPVSLCLVDLRENGEAIRSARAFRSQFPDSVVIGVADPARPAAAAG